MGLALTPCLFLGLALTPLLTLGISHSGEVMSDEDDIKWILDTNGCTNYRYGLDTNGLDKKED
jgi:hypothetical protein